jgi:hypothetical protein
MPPGFGLGTVGWKFGSCILNAVDFLEIVARASDATFSRPILRSRGDRNLSSSSKGATMRAPNRSLLVLVIAASVPVALSSETANSAILLVTSRAALAGTDNLNWGDLGPENTELPSPVSITSDDGLLVNVSQTAGRRESVRPELRRTPIGNTRR